MEIVAMDTTYQQVEDWLTKVVIGLNLCPFAARPKQLDQIDIIVSDAQSHDQLLADLQVEMKRLAETPASVLETTLVAVPHLLQEFEEYNLFLDIVDRLLIHSGYEGAIQVASFHPNYRFEGTQAEDDENLTNRSPVPIFHLLRELSVTNALQHYRDPEQIPVRNAEKMRNLTPDEKKRFFPYLVKS